MGCAPLGGGSRKPGGPASAPTKSAIAWRLGLVQTGNMVYTLLGYRVKSFLITHKFQSKLAAAERPDYAP